LSAQLEPGEVSALLGPSGSTPASVQVAERDFRSPRRIGHEELAELTRSLAAAARKSEAAAGAVTGGREEVELAGVRELDAERWRGELQDPLALLRFKTGGQLGWLHWECRAALATIERVLGSAPAGDLAARALLPVEARVFRSLALALVQPYLEALGVSATDWTLVTSTETVGSWKDASGHGDPHRLCIELAYHGSGEPSVLRLLLPGFPKKPAAPAKAATRGGALPQHLARVEVELHAELPGGELPLSQLLSLEEGDVIPIDARIGDPLIACVEGQRFARAELGQYRGQLAMRIEDFEPQPDEDR
jgi:flagellar motor switch protein FliM